jgi:ribonuclease P protein subunit RPR2
VIAKITMAKAGKSAKSGSEKGITQKHVHSRISYLYQAATYLSTIRMNGEKESPEELQEDKTGLQKSSQSAEQVNACESPERIENSIEMDGKRPKDHDILLKSSRSSDALAGSTSQTHHLLASMRSISTKTQIRLSQSIKRSVCRRCNALLTLNSTAEIENLSRGGRKARADVLVVKCCQCAFEKRYPVGMGEGENKKKKTKKTKKTTKKKVAGVVTRMGIQR